MKSILSLSLLVLSFSLSAQVSLPEKGQTLTYSKSDIMIAYELANDLVEYGFNNESAFSLVAAAEILIAYPSQEMIIEKSEEGPQNQSSKEESEITLEVGPLLETAKSFNDDQDVVTVIDNLLKQAQTPSRGRVYGPAMVERTVEANSFYTDYILFEGGAPAEIMIIGDGDTDLDVYVYDSEGNLIAYDESDNDREYVSFNPVNKESFEIKVVNRGDVYNEYFLLSN